MVGVEVLLIVAAVVRSLFVLGVTDTHFLLNAEPLVPHASTALLRAVVTDMAPWNFWHEA